MTIDLVEEQFEQMTEGAVLPKGEWSYGMDISHHQPVIRWNKLKILLDEDGRTVWREEEAVGEQTIYRQCWISKSLTTVLKKHLTAPIRPVSDRKVCKGKKREMG